MNTPALRHHGIDGYMLEDLSVGMTAVFSKTITEADIVLFAGMTGDMNPVHVDADYAAHSPFGGRIAHGMLTASLISTVLGTKLPGPGCIYVSQTLKFLAPVRIGDTALARVTITEIVPARRRLVLRTEVSVGDVTVLSGEAVAKVPSRA